MVVASWFSKPSLCSQLIDHYDNENQQHVKEWGCASRLSTRWDLEFGGWGGDEEEMEDDVSEHTMVEGDHRLRKINWMLDQVMVGMGWERTESQVMFHQFFTMAALAKIYGKDWERVSARVMAKFGVRKIDQLVLGMTPRRWGKTIAVSSFCAVLLLCVPGIHISTFSTGKRASSLLMQSMMRMMSGVEGANDRIVKSNAEELCIAQGRRHEGVGQQSDAAKRMAADTTTSVFHSYPSSVDGQCHLFTHLPSPLRYTPEKEEKNKTSQTGQNITHVIGLQLHSLLHFFALAYSSRYSLFMIAPLTYSSYNASFMFSGSRASTTKQS